MKTQHDSIVSKQQVHELATCLTDSMFKLRLSRASTTLDHFFKITNYINDYDKTSGSYIIMLHPFLIFGSTGPFVTVPLDVLDLGTITFVWALLS